MRSFLIIITGILISYNVSGQRRNVEWGTSENPFMYGEMAISYGTHLSGKVGINTIYPNDNILSVIAFFDTRRDPNAPSDFKQGLIATNPQQTLYMTGVCLGKVLYTDHQAIRYTVKGGASLGMIRTPENYEGNSGLFNSNYTYSHKTQVTAGLLINPTVEFAIARRFGFSFGMFSNVTFNSLVVGMEGGILFGRLRNRKA